MIHVAGGSYRGKIHTAVWQDRFALCCWCWRNLNVYVNVIKYLKNNAAFGCEGGKKSNILRTIAKAQFTGWLRSSTWYIFYILLPYLARPPPPKYTISLRTVRKTPFEHDKCPVWKMLQFRNVWIVVMGASHSHAGRLRLNATFQHMQTAMDTKAKQICTFHMNCLSSVEKWLCQQQPLWSN